ncbi:MAG: hypothetical protein Dasosvirus2_34 [Dasosvirus sp.]|uniref:Uncharacterized protein n=1 Tax=Dasosvirus sp. TaxID=2487764 RepID=A0A3G4ZRB3_9VIRU|nr:MAG: hypothetical protein Dasosvirus2_34 [Dasosvirus sp.]
MKVIEKITKIYIITNALRLGWNVEVKKNRKIILSKPICDLNSLDMDTPKLLNVLISNTF